MYQNRYAFVVAHPDDEVITCGGTLIKLVKDGYDVKVILFCDHNKNPSFSSKRMECFYSVMEQLGTSFVVLGNEAYDIDVKKSISSLKTHICDRDTIITHHYFDYNNDHRLVFDAVKEVKSDSSTVLLMDSYNARRKNIVKNGIKFLVSSCVENQKLKYIAMYDAINRGVCHHRYSMSYVMYNDIINSSAFNHKNDEYAELYEVYSIVQ